jgi:hypothetical protein
MLLPVTSCHVTCCVTGVTSVTKSSSEHAAAALCTLVPSRQGVGGPCVLPIQQRLPLFSGVGAAHAVVTGVNGRLRCTQQTTYNKDDALMLHCVSISFCDVTT